MMISKEGERMKSCFRYLTMLFCFGVCITSLVFSTAFADELDSGSADGSGVSAGEPAESSPAEVTTVADENGVIVNVVLPAADPADQESEAGDGESTSDEFSLLPETAAVTGDSTSNADAAAPLDGFPAMVVSLFGEYTPKTYSVTTYLSDGSTVTTTEYVPGLAGLDWPWLAGVVLFALVLWSFFRLLGGVLRHG